MTPSEEAAAARQMMANQFNEFAKLLEPDQEAIATFFVSGHAFRVRVSQIGSTSTGLINVFGEDTNGLPIDIFFHHTQLSYVVETVFAGRQTRLGFDLTPRISG